MPRGGARTPGPGKKQGRPKQERPTDAVLAAKILAKVKAEELWLESIEKARKARTTGELTGILKYLEDRVHGKTQQKIHYYSEKPVEVTGPDGGPIPLKLTIEDVNLRITELLTRAGGSAPRK